MHCAIRHHSAIVTQHLAALLKNYDVQGDASYDNSIAYDLLLVDDTHNPQDYDSTIIICLEMHQSDDIEAMLQRGYDDVLLLPCDDIALQSKLEQWRG